MIIAGFLGVGKTTFCEQYKGKALDFGVMPIKYKNFGEVAEKQNDSESVKKNEDLDLRQNWELYYYTILKYVELKFPKLLIEIPTIERILYRLDEDKINYTLVYPNSNLKEEYVMQYINRGDMESAFRKVFCEWDFMMSRFEENKHSKRIKLQSGEVLSDVIKEDWIPNQSYDFVIEKIEHMLSDESEMEKAFFKIREKKGMITGKRYTWEQIKKIFPRQWVGLVDVEWEDEINVKSAVVKYVDKTRDELMLQQMTTEKDLYGVYTTPNDATDMGGFCDYSLDE